MAKTLGFVFPGQGSQSVGMLARHFANFKEFNNIFDISKEITGIDFKNLIQAGSAEELSATKITQPLLLTANHAIWQTANMSAKDISFMAGHSLGEYSAYIAAESLRFDDALELVSLRAEYMQEAVEEGEGGIAAIIGLTEEVLSLICNEITKQGDLVSMANLNSNNQIVISGTRDGVDKAIERCKENGAKRAIPLAMSVPSHCKLMTPASIKFSKAIDGIDFLQPKTNVIQNFSVLHSDDAQTIKDNLVSQIHSPVRWSETMEYFQNNGITDFYECGPSTVLSGLVKRKFESVQIHSLDNFDTLNKITVS